MKNNNKILCLLLAVGVLFTLTCVGVNAATPARSGNIKSHGVFHSYDVNGNDILLDSADLYFLANQLDGLEDTINALSRDNNANVSYVYHNHVDAVGDVNHNSVVYSNTNVGGCYVPSGHTHNALGACSTTTTTVQARCGTLCTTKVSEHWYWDGCDWHPHLQEAAKQYRCPVCGFDNRVSWGRHEAEPMDPVYCSNTVTKTVTVYACGSPVNTYVLGCGRREGEIESAVVSFSPSGN